MINLNNVEFLTTSEKVNFILNNIDQLSIYSFYCSDITAYKDTINSPLRKDNVPSFNVFVSGQKVIYKDFGTGDSGDVFEFVGKLFYISFTQVVDKILLDFGYLKNALSITNEYRQILEREKVKQITRVSLRANVLPWDKNSYSFWKQYGINLSTLKLFKVFNINIIYYGDNFWKQSSYNNPIYGYLFHKDNEFTWKFYLPKSKEMKWCSNIDRSILQGWEVLPKKGELLIITKSLKDVMVLYELGYNSIAIQSESSSIKPQIAEELKSRFEKIYSLMDFELAGVKSANKMKKDFSIKYKFLQNFRTRSNGEKDISDVYLLKGKEYTINKLKQLFK